QGEARNPHHIPNPRGRRLQPRQGRHQPLDRPHAPRSRPRIPPTRLMTRKSEVGSRQSEVLPRQRTRTADVSGSKTGSTDVHASTPTRGGFRGVVPPPECSEGKWSWISG